MKLVETPVATPGHVWAMIYAPNQVWHGYTKKAAKLDGGVDTARPICGKDPFAVGETDYEISTTQWTPVGGAVACPICLERMTARAANRGRR